MNCRRAQAALSERMDGEHLSSRLAVALERHVARCPRCSAFLRDSERLRATVRIAPAIAVPDLVEPIMTAVAREARGRHTLKRPELAPARTPPLRPPLSRRLAPAVAGLLVGAVVGSVLVGGPWRRPIGEPPIALADVTRGVAAAASGLDDYRARFSILERNFDPQVRFRELTLNLSFRAPERFRMDVVDHTSYPSRDWTPNDISLVVNRSRWSLDGPTACPAGIHNCPRTRTVVLHRAPFSSATPVPTDLLVPFGTIRAGQRMRLLGETMVLGRTAVEIELPLQQATPLLPFLRVGGQWRPLYAGDRVVLSLDAQTWFPLQLEVFPSASDARDQWELRFGLPDESPDEPVLTVEALDVLTRLPPPGTFAIPATGQVQDEGAHPLPLEDLPRGFVSLEELDGLDAYRAAHTPVGESAGAEQTVVTYAQGLTWVKLAETRGWERNEPYGPVDRHAEEVEVPGGGVAYFEPASESLGRRLAIHTDRGDLYVETNLPRERLLEIAGALGVRGASLPEGWRVREAGAGVAVRVSLEEAQEQVDFPIMLPRDGLPAGYVLASVEVVRLGQQSGLNAYFSQRESELGAGPIRLHLEEARELPPAPAARQSSVEVRGLSGRWLSERGQLEWIEDGIYVSLDASDASLRELLEVAQALSPMGEPSSEEGR